MATISSGYTFVNNETVTPAKLNSLAGGATLSALVDADVSASAAISDTKLATISTAGKVNGSALVAGSVPQSSFSSSIILVPTGAVMPFAMNSAPTGWLAANGAQVSRSTYSTLFTAIGTTYGSGDGSTTFTLPDLRASFVRGAGSDGVATSGTFGTKQADDFKSHSHTTAYNGTITGATGAYAYGNAPQASYPGVQTDATGGTETRPRNIAMLYCIKF